MIAPQIERKKSPVLKSTENNRHKFTSIMLYYCLTRKKLISHAESILRHQTKLPPTKAIMCLLLHQFNALIKSQWHKPINRLGVQLKKNIHRIYVCLYIHVVKMLFDCSCRTILWWVFAIFSFIEIFRTMAVPSHNSYLSEHLNVTSQFECTIFSIILFLSLFFALSPDLSFHFLDTREHARE